MIVTPCAEQDYGEIVHYLGDVLHSRQAVASFVRRLDECLHHLQETPEMYEFSQEPLLRARGYRKFLIGNYVALYLGQFTRNYTQTVKRAADNKRRYAPGWVHSTCLLRGFPKGAAPHLAHDFAEQSVVCYTLCRRCPENTVAAGEGKGI